MKVAVPVSNKILCTHFGHTEEFAIFETSNGEITKEQYLPPPKHEPGVFPRWLHELGVTDIIASGIGQRAINLFLNQEINVYFGVEQKSPRELVLNLLNNTLKAGVNMCDH